MALMRFGIRFNSDSGTLKEVVRWAQLAEHLGFDNFWYCHDLMKRDAWVTLAAVAAATHKIHIGTCIVNPFTTSPAEIAMHAATLQELSEGRFVLGIGPGDPPYQDWVGVRPTKPRTGLAEAVHLLRALFNGTEVSFAGQHFAWRNAKLRMPIPPVPIPIYIGGQGPRVLELMGELGDGALPIVFPPETIDHVQAHIHRGMARSALVKRHLPFDLAACVWWSIAPTQAAAEDALRYLIAYYGPSLRAETLAPIGLQPSDFAAVRDAWRNGDMDRAMRLVQENMFQLAIYGAPQDMVAKVRWLQSKGVTQINIGPPLGPNREQALRQTGEMVMREFK
jgi:5,10-methylenetetrahydromethanopterin reductase